MHGVRLLTACVPVALAGLLLTACTRATPTASEPSATPTVTVTASPTPSPSPTPTLPATRDLRLQPYKTIRSNSTIGTLSPKSVVASGDGVVMAQNMIYNHTVTVFDSDGNWIATIPDAVKLADFGITGYPAGTVKGGPVELAFSPDKKKAYTSNYSMYGPGFGREGGDTCNPSSNIDKSFVYRIDVATHTVDQVIPVGKVPKYVATTPDGRYVLVTNWCSYSLSVIDVATQQVVKELAMGAYPRGIAVSADSSTAYVAIMGSTQIKVVNLASFEVTAFQNVGSGPRHLVLSPDGDYLYVSLNADGRIAKLDARTGKVLAKVATGSAPRSMDISADGQSLYVVNYESGTVSKVTTDDMKEVQELRTAYHPIGITYDLKTGRVWVACYGGEIQIFDEKPAGAV
jgi:YVTN family beta-propeller protein